MLERIPTVPTPQELLDRAFSKAARIDIPDPDRYHRIRKTEVARLDAAADNITASLRKQHDAWPNVRGLRDYNVELLDILAGVGELQKALGSVHWAIDTIESIVRDTKRQMARVRKDVDGFFQGRKRAYGRISSVVEELEPALALLAKTRDQVRLLPTVSPDYATIVVAGYPNVGKTSLLRAWTASRAEVKPYAFTTKRAEVGHFTIADAQGVETQFQVVDTPGLLDRPAEDRNEIERQAMAALHHAADAVLFLLDPSESCGYPLAAQEALLEQVQTEMPGLPFLVAESKADLVSTDSPRHHFSTTTGLGVAELRAAVVAAITVVEPELEEDPLDRWRRVPDDDW